MADGGNKDKLLNLIDSDARRLGVRRWWLVLPAAFLVGLSLALPLYLYLRHDYQGGIKAGA
jgi:hypothetical protein